MNTIRPCGCKGIRTCLKCETDFNIAKQSLQTELQKLKPYSYCVPCGKLYPGWDIHEVRSEHPNHNKASGTDFPGVMVLEDFLSTKESTDLIAQLDLLPWTISQSGRRKQNFGPKTNFKKRKLQVGAFVGFPECSQFIQDRFRLIDLLQNFQTIEQCTLEYEPINGASIDQHIDDCWIWGERVVTVNCLGDAVLTLTLYDQEAAPTAKYNLDLLPEYSDKLRMPLRAVADLNNFKNCVIRVPMPKCSLIVLYGPARYQFEHAVLREDIKERRVCIAYREFTPMYINGESKDKGEIVMKNAQKFWDVK